MLSGPLEDKIANTTSELKNVIFVEGFGAITDLEVGPDGYLYTYQSIGQGKIYRILPNPRQSFFVYYLQVCYFSAPT